MNDNVMNQEIIAVVGKINDLEVSKTTPNIKSIKSALLDTEYALISKNIDDRSLWSRLLNVHDKNLDEAYQRMLHALEQADL